MGILCKHKWKVISEEGMPSDDDDEFLDEVGIFFTSRHPFRSKRGFTVVIVKCKKCDTTREAVVDNYFPPQT